LVKVYIRRRSEYSDLVKSASPNDITEPVGVVSYGLCVLRGGKPGTYQPLPILRAVFVAIDNWQSDVCNE
jgi:hypothetical protein